MTQRQAKFNTLRDVSPTAIKACMDEVLYSAAKRGVEPRHVHLTSVEPTNMGLNYDGEETYTWTFNYES